MCYCSEHDAGLVPAFAGTGSLVCQDVGCRVPHSFLTTPSRKFLMKKLRDQNTGLFGIGQPKKEIFTWRMI